MKNLILLLSLVFLSLTVQAQNSSSFKFEPIYGIEHSEVIYPEPARFVTRSTVGARILYGVPLLSGELEYTQGNSRRDYPASNQKVEDSVQRGMVGLRSTVGFGKWIGAFFRAGARLSKEKTTITDTSTNIVTIKEPPISFDPYAGTGLQIAIANNFALNAGATIIFTHEFPPKGKYDVQYTFGFTAKFGQVR